MIGERDTSTRSVRIVRPWEAEDDERCDVVVVIDVLRATTTAAYLTSRGRPFLALENPDAVATLQDSERYSVLSELEIPSPWHHLDNSPEIARTAQLREMAVLITTNGTRAIHRALRMTDTVILGSFVNLSAANAWVSSRGGDIVLMPAGYIPRSETRHEDEACAAALADAIAGSATAADLQRAADSCWQDARILRRLDLKAALEVDFKLALAVDTLDCVPRVEATDPQVLVSQAKI